MGIFDWISGKEKFQKDTLQLGENCFIYFAASGEVSFKHIELQSIDEVNLGTFVSTEFFESLVKKNLRTSLKTIFSKSSKTMLRSLPKRLRKITKRIKRKKNYQVRKIKDLIKRGWLIEILMSSLA